jgi:hypothetical protein
MASQFIDREWNQPCYIVTALIMIVTAMFSQFTHENMGIWSRAFFPVGPRQGTPALFRNVLPGNASSRGR